MRRRRYVDGSLHLRSRTLRWPTRIKSVQRRRRLSMRYVSCFLIPAKQGLSLRFTTLYPPELPMPPAHVWGWADGIATLAFVIVFFPRYLI